MTIAELLLPEFDQEMGNTHKVLERVPADKFEWRSHPKSNTIGWVTRHVAEIPGWIAMTIPQSSLDLNPPGGEKYTPSTETDLTKILAQFEKNVVDGRALLAETSDATFAEPWTLLSGGTEIFTMPKYSVVRTFVINHMIHHRSHLLAYLRLNNIPVPGLYGPSADEGGI